MKRGQQPKTDPVGYISLLLVLLSIMCVLFTGCVSSKKTTTTNLRKTDSVTSSASHTNTDTASKRSVVKAQDVDIWYNYDTAPSPAAIALAVAKAKNTKPTSDDPVFDFVPHQGLESVHIHIGTVTDSTTSSSKQITVDTTHRQTVAHTDLQQTIVEKKTLIPWWIYVAGGILLLVIILIIIYKIVK